MVGGIYKNVLTKSKEPFSYILKKRSKSKIGRKLQWKWSWEKLSFLGTQKRIISRKISWRQNIALWHILVYIMLK